MSKDQLAVGEPTHDYLWIEPMHDVEGGGDMEQTASGLWLPSVEAGENGGNRKVGRGRVIAVGPGVFTDAGHRKPMCAEVGDVVYYFHEPFTIVALGRQVHVLQDYKVIFRVPAAMAKAQPKKGEAA